MPRSRRPFTLVSAFSHRATASRVATSAKARVLLLAIVALFASTAEAQGRGASDTPLHVTVNSFEFVALGDTQPAARPLNVHNGGTARFTDVRLTRLTYADPARGAAWLIAHPRQTAVAPDELATVGMLCVDASGLKAGTYRATAAVRAREVPEPVAITITLIVKDSGARARRAGPRCGTTVTK